LCEPTPLPALCVIFPSDILLHKGSVLFSTTAFFDLQPSAGVFFALASTVELPDLSSLEANSSSHGIR